MSHDVSLASGLTARAYNSGACELWELEDHYRVRDVGSGRMRDSNKAMLLVGDQKLKVCLVFLLQFLNESMKKIMTANSWIRLTPPRITWRDILKIDPIATLPENIQILTMSSGD